MKKSKINWLKITLGLGICFIIRLFPFRPPNIEPILATQMPFSKAYGPLVGFFFAFFGIILFDLATGHYGVWSYLTAGAYGILGIWAFYFFRKRESTRWNYVRFAIMGTLFFDIITGLSVGPMFFNQPFMEALIGQIPFTLWHLLGNVSFAFILSPAIYNYVIENKNLKPHFLISILRAKKNI